MVISKPPLQSFNKYALKDKFALFSVLLQQNAGRLAQGSVWVFEMIDTSSQPARDYMQIVPAKRQDYPNRRA